METCLIVYGCKYHVDQFKNLHSRYSASVVKCQVHSLTTGRKNTLRIFGYGKVSNNVKYLICSK